MSDQVWNRDGLPRYSVALRDGVWTVVPGGCNTWEEARAMADAYSKARAQDEHGSCSCNLVATSRDDTAENPCPDCAARAQDEKGGPA